MMMVIMARSALGRTSRSRLALFALGSWVMDASLAKFLFAALAARSSELLDVTLFSPEDEESFLAELFPDFFFSETFFFRGVLWGAVTFLAATFILRGTFFDVATFLTFIAEAFFFREFLLGFPTFLVKTFFLFSCEVFLLFFSRGAILDTCCSLDGSRSTDYFRNYSKILTLFLSIQI